MQLLPGVSVPDPTSSVIAPRDETGAGFVEGTIRQRQKMCAEHFIEDKLAPNLLDLGSMR